MLYSWWTLTIWLLLAMVATLTSVNDACITEEQYKDISKKDLSDLEERLKEELWRMKERQTYLESIIRNMADSLSTLSKKISPHCTESWRTESPNTGGAWPTELPIMYGIEINEDTTLYEAFYEAARTGDIGYIHAVLARGNSSSINIYSLITWRNEDYGDLTSLHVAAAWGHDQVVLALLEAGASAGVQDREGFTPLVWAAWQGQSETLNILLQPKYLAQVSNQQFILWMAISKKQLVVVEALINNGTSVLVADERGSNALHYAAGNNSFDMARLLLQKGVDKRQKNDYGYTPSDWARERGNDELANFIDNWQ